MPLYSFERFKSTQFFRYYNNTLKNISIELDRTIIRIELIRITFSIQLKRLTIDEFNLF